MSLDTYKSHFPFEFCATRFLCQWEKREKNLFEGLSAGPTDKLIVEALAYFQVARNFKGLTKDQKAAGRIRTSLLNVQNDVTLTSPVGKVDALVTALQNDFGKFNISAATKLLWLSYRDPFVVYDKRAITALTKKAKHRNISKNYSNYTVAWRSEYAKSEKGIVDAIANLPNGRSFMPKTSLTDANLIALSTEQWFKERVFDIFLWEVGGDS